MTDGYWYLATPYSKFPGGHEAAFDLACEQAALLLNHRISTFCPIAHSHPLVAHGLKAVDHDFWINVVDRPLMEGAKGLIFLEAESWPQSSGMHEEIVEFVKAGKPVVFMQPGVVPEELLDRDRFIGSSFASYLEEEDDTALSPEAIAEVDAWLDRERALLQRKKAAAEEDAFWDDVFSGRAVPPVEWDIDDEKTRSDRDEVHAEDRLGEAIQRAYQALLKATSNDHTAVMEFNILVDDGIEPSQASRIAAEDWAKRQPSR